eukprot:scaffold167_cov110-Cylindrotheca_fusiformis.AAC.17
MRNKTAATMNQHASFPEPPRERFAQLEIQLTQLNARLDSLSDKFELLTENVRQRNVLLQNDLKQQKLRQRIISTNAPADKQMMKENVKRALLGDEEYSIYRKTLKPKNASKSF